MQQNETTFSSLILISSRNSQFRILRRAVLTRIRFSTRREAALFVYVVVHYRILLSPADVYTRLSIFWLGGCPGNVCFYIPGELFCAPLGLQMGLRSLVECKINFVAFVLIRRISLGLQKSFVSCMLSLF